jgi:hypothetical protein
MPNSEEIKGNWNEMIKLKQKYAELTEMMMFEEGQDDEKCGKLQQKLGKN